MLHRSLYKLQGHSCLINAFLLEKAWSRSKYSCHEARRDKTKSYWYCRSHWVLPIPKVSSGNLQYFPFVLAWSVTSGVTSSCWYFTSADWWHRAGLCTHIATQGRIHLSEVCCPAPCEILEQSWDSSWLVRERAYGRPVPSAQAPRSPKLSEMAQGPTRGQLNQTTKLQQP